MYTIIAVILFLIGLAIFLRGIKIFKNGRKSVSTVFMIIGLLIFAASVIFLYLILSGRLILPLGR